MIQFQQMKLLQSSVQFSDEQASNFLIAVVLSAACVGGVLHGVAMGLRKYYGEGRPKYWLEWRWWIGVVTDAIGGCSIWPAMPFVSVHLLVPLIIVIQLASSYIFGVTIFEEKSNGYSNWGLLFSAIGVIGLSLSTEAKAALFDIDSFWINLVTWHFLVTSAMCLVSIAGSFFICHRSAFWALASGLLEGWQYLCSRSLAVAIHDGAVFSFHSAVVGAITMKVCCILLILHFQQIGLEADLFRFAGIYLVSTTSFICLYGFAFFGDALPLSASFALSAIATLAGIWLLNQGMTETQAEKKSCIEDAPLAQA
mmetsp:Transcript_62564/g.97357  ORF Transcript_62564/g.97357 Transcript_62564/m.97357 type:complete len:311 (-) Transcript_62564:54-986(-)